MAGNVGRLANGELRITRPRSNDTNVNRATRWRGIQAVWGNGRVAVAARQEGAALPQPVATTNRAVHQNEKSVHAAR